MSSDVPEAAVRDFTYEIISSPLYGENVSHSSCLKTKAKNYKILSFLFSGSSIHLQKNAVNMEISLQIASSKNSWRLIFLLCLDKRVDFSEE
jgi:hypothetical protein